MDSLYGTDRKLGDLEDSGVSEFLLDQDIFPATSNMFQVLTSSMKDPTKCEPTDRPASPELFNWCPEIKLSSDHYVDNDWFNSLLEDPVLNDKMITDAVQSPRVTSDHSYSLNNDQTLASLCKMDDFGKDMDTDIFDTNHGALDLSQKNYAIPTQIIVKQEPSSSSSSSSSSSPSSERERIGHNSIINNNNSNSNSCSSSSSNNNNIITATLANITNSSSIANSLSTTFTISSGNHSANNNNTSSNLIESPFLNNISETTSNVQPPAMIFTTTTASSSPPSSLLTTEASCPVKRETPILPNISIKSEPTEFMDTSPDSSGYDSMNLPPTPPSSNTSDSEGSLSPPRSAPSSPVRPVSSTKSLASSTSKHISQPLFTSPIPQSGYLVLSEEEKRTLIAEGYPIPGKLPLTKQEEKNLKKIRRKIKNKISAQESRRKKKEYLETLEKQVEAFTQENVDLKKKVDSLENNNRSLIGQLQKLQAQCGKLPQSSSASSTQTGTVLMVVVLSFAVFLGSWAPTSLNIGYSSPSTHPGIFYSNPRPMHPSPSMGPSLQNVRVADYQSGSIKSRVLVSVRDELENDAWFGPNVPMKNTAAAAAADQSEVADSPQNTNKSVTMETKPFKWQLPSFKIPYIAKSPLPPPPSNTSPFELAFIPVTKKSKVSFATSKILPDLRDLVESLPNLQLENNISSVDRGKPLAKALHTPS